jgi:predicted O-methyltransferase YrrM
MGAAWREIFDAFPGVEQVNVEMGTIRYTNNNLDPFEQFALGAICQLRKPRRIFEIGTFDGATTMILATSAPDAEILTLDLPPAAANAATDATEAANAAAGLVGVRFRDTPQAERITQLFGDSRQFDFSPWYGTVDLVLVDAGHDYEFVVSDTRSALRLLAPGGVIIWDDYMPYFPGVVRAVDESGVSVFHLTRSDFAVHDSASSS